MKTQHFLSSGVSPWHSSPMFPSAQVLYPDIGYASINNNVNVPRGYPRGFSWRLLAAICRSCIRSVPRRLGERHDAVCTEIPQNVLQPTADRFVAPIFRRSVAAVCSSYGWRRKMIQTPGAVQTSQLIPRQAIG